MKTIIAGSRIATLDEVIEALKTCPWLEDITEVVSGRARGADSYGELLAEEYDIPVKLFPAKWKDENGKYDRGAGLKRNVEMAKYSDALIAVDCGTTGTKHMIETAKKYKLKIHVYTRK
jgi:hypothetical protein